MRPVILTISLMFGLTSLSWGEEVFNEDYQESYEETTYEEESYSDDYQAEDYQQDNYSEESYPEDNYTEESYAEEPYQEPYEDAYNEPTAAEPAQDVSADARATCQKWAKEAGLTGEEKTYYMEDCIASQVSY